MDPKKVQQSLVAVNDFGISSQFEIKRDFDVDIEETTGKIWGPEQKKMDGVFGEPVG